MSYTDLKDIYVDGGTIEDIQTQTTELQQFGSKYSHHLVTGYEIVYKAMPYNAAETERRMSHGVVEMCESDHAQPPPRYPSKAGGLVWAHTELYLEGMASYDIGAEYTFICVHCQRRWTVNPASYEKAGEMCITSLEWE
jgi:hypothetical protein